MARRNAPKAAKTNALAGTVPANGRKSKTTPAPKVQPAPKAAKALDPKKANPTLWARAKAEAHEEIAALSRHLCACGCGKTTKNTFCPGHDAILQSRRANELFAQLVQHGDTDNASPLLDAREDATEAAEELGGPVGEDDAPSEDQPAE